MKLDGHFDNPNPVVYATEEHDIDGEIEEGLSVGAIFSVIRDISDPEFPYTLEQVTHFSGLFRRVRV